MQTTGALMVMMSPRFCNGSLGRGLSVLTLTGLGVVGKEGRIDFPYVPFLLTLLNQIYDSFHILNGKHLSAIYWTDFLLFSKSQFFWLNSTVE
jgi:hypothetical protein